jgi:hypothetical protein
MPVVVLRDVSAMPRAEPACLMDCGAGSTAAVATGVQTGSPAGQPICREADASLSPEEASEAVRIGRQDSLGFQHHSASP